MDQHFDKHQFADRRQHTVRADSDGHGGFTTPGISFEDFSRMSTTQRKTTGERRLPTPTWAINDKELQHVLVVFMEVRAGFRKHSKPLVENKKDLTPEALKARLEKAKEKVLSRRDGQMATMKKLNEEYIELQQLGSDEDPRCRQLEHQIASLDTYLRYSQNGGAAVVAAMVYLYYRAAQDSVGVASELGIKPMHVRQTLWRLHRAADLIAGIKRVVPTNEEREARKLVRAEKARLEKEARAANAAERAEIARRREAERTALMLEGAARRVEEEARWAARRLQEEKNKAALRATRSAPKPPKAVRVPKPPKPARLCSCGKALPPRCSKFCAECRPTPAQSAAASRGPRPVRLCACGNELPFRAVKFCAECRPTHAQAVAACRERKRLNRVCACGKALPRSATKYCAECKPRRRRPNLSKGCHFCGGPLPKHARNVCASAACQKAYKKKRSGRYVPRKLRMQIVKLPAPPVLKRVPRWLAAAAEAI